MEKYYRVSLETENIFEHHSLFFDVTQKQMVAWQEVLAAVRNKTALNGIPFESLEFEWGHLRGIKCASVCIKGVCAFKTLEELQTYFNQAIYQQSRALEHHEVVIFVGESFGSFLEANGERTHGVKPKKILKRCSLRSVGIGG